MSSVGLGVLGLLVGLILGMSGVLIGMFTSYITTKLGHKASSNAVAGAGLLVIAYMIMMLLIISSLVTIFIESITLNYQQALLIAVPILTIAVGLSLIRRYFWHAPVVSISHVKTLSVTYLTKANSVLQPLLVAGILLYAIAPTLLLAVFSFSLISLLLGETSLLWSVAFSIGVITPLYGVLTLLSTKTKASKVLSWQEKTKATMFLYNGLVLILLSWIVFYITILEDGL